MIVIPGPIPLAIHPFFWVFAFFISWIMGQTLPLTLIWFGIIFFSVIIHEYGHALMATLFKQKARIQLIAMGGVTSFEGPRLKFWQQFLITFNGPFFGFLLFLLATVLLEVSFPPLMMKILKMTQVANLFWTIVNLLPVLPLDGGQLLRIVLEALFGVRGFKASLLVGACFAALIALYFFMIQGYLIGAFFFLFAFQSFEMWRRSRFITRDDRDDENKTLLMQAEKALNEGRKEEAKRVLEEIKKKTGNGVLGAIADQYLAFLEIEEGKRKEAYERLLPVQEHLTEDALCLLHELASEQKNYSLVIDLSAKCYQIDPSQKMAINNARAFAHEKMGKHAGGWLQTAWQYGSFNVAQLLQEESFEAVKEDPEFKKFLETMQ